MNIRYVYTKKEYKKYLLSSRLLNSIFITVLLILLFYIFLKDKLVFKFYVYIIIIPFLILVCNLIYVSLYVKLKKNLYGIHTLEFYDTYFTLKINDNISKYDYKNIKKIKEKKKYLLILFKRNKEYLKIDKNKISIKECNDLIKYLKNKIGEV